VEKSCVECAGRFTALRASKVFCSVRCQDAAGRKRRAAGPLLPRECPTCLQQFQPKRKDKFWCSETCYSKSANAKPRRPSTAAIVDNTVTARILADGFFLGDLLPEIERIRKTTSVASLEAALVEAVAVDALWPVGRSGRIAVVLALLKNPSLAQARWRHPHEPRHSPGAGRKPSQLAFRVGRVHRGSGP
jgi:hypothetical protein